MKGLSKTNGLCSRLLPKIKVTAMQYIALYEAELQCKNQKNYKKDLQKLTNQQAWSITEMYQSSLILSLMNDLELSPAHIVVDLQ